MATQQQKETEMTEEALDCLQVVIVRVSLTQYQYVFRVSMDSDFSLLYKHLSEIF